MIVSSVLKLPEELAGLLKIKFHWEIRTCSKCFIQQDCAHLKGHPQDGCIRFIHVDETSGEVAFFLNFKIQGESIVILDWPAFSLTFLANREKNTLEGEVVRKLGPFLAGAAEGGRFQ